MNENNKALEAKAISLLKNVKQATTITPPDLAVLATIKTNPYFALMFAIENNPQGVLDALSASGLVPIKSSGDSKTWSYEILKAMLESDKQRAINLISKVRYKINSKAVWTISYSSYFIDTQKNTNNLGAKFSVDALLGGLGAGLSAYSGASMGNEGSSSSGMSDAQLQAEQDAKDKADAEAKKKKRNNIIYISAGGLVLLIVLYVMFKPKKEVTTV